MIKENKKNLHFVYQEAVKDDKSEKEAAVKDGKIEKPDSKSGKEGDKGKAKDAKDKGITHGENE